MKTKLTAALLAVLMTGSLCVPALASGERSVSPAASALSETRSDTTDDAAETTDGSEKTPLLTANGTRIGDMNGDDELTAADSLILARYLAGWDEYEGKIEDPDAADIDGNEAVDARDRMILARYIAGKGEYENYFVKEEQYYSVTFDPNGDGVENMPEAQRVKAGECAKEPNIPLRSGYVFAGWYELDNPNSPFCFDRIIDKDIKLYAKWVGRLIQNESLDHVYFTTDTWDVEIGKNVVVTFTAAIEGDGLVQDSDVKVVNNTNDIVGYMNDNGKDGDAIPNDNTFTLQINVSSERVQNVSYHAEIDRDCSNSVTVGFYDPNKKIDDELVKDVFSELFLSVKDCLDENEMLIDEKENEAIESIQNKLSRLKEDDIIKDYNSIDSYEYSITLHDDIVLSYSLSRKDLLSGGTDLRIGTYRTVGYLDGDVDTGAKYQMLRLIDDSTKDVIKRLPEGKTGQCVSYNKDEIDLDSLADGILSRKSIIIWVGHGNFNTTYGSYLGIPQLVTAEYSDKYEADISSGRVLIAGQGSGRHYVISGGFIQKYYCKHNSMDGCVVYLCACNSMDDAFYTSEYCLARSFINCGAAYVIGSQGELEQQYGCKFGRSFLDYCTRKDKSNNNEYYSIIDSFYKADEDHKHDFMKYGEMYILSHKSANLSDDKLFDHLKNNVLDSGDCGENLYWWLYDDGELEIYGKGDMWDYNRIPYGEYSWQSTAPWSKYRDSLRGLSIGREVTSIGNYAFFDCERFTGNLIIPNSVTKIGIEAFIGCKGFTGNLTIPNSVKEIGIHAFCGCTGFTGNLTLPNNITSIGSSMFYGCTGLKGDLTIPDSVKTIGDGAFQGCAGFTGNLTIPNSVTTIGDSAFSGCSGFTGSLMILNGVTTIGSYAFYGCSGFTGSLTIPNFVTTIGDSAFSGCSGFTGSLTIGNSVTTIGGDAFRNCSGFTGSLTIGNSVTSIGSRAFMQCYCFTGILSIPPTVTRIEADAFRFGGDGITCAYFYGNKPTVTYSNAAGQHSIFGLRDSSFIVYHLADKEGWPAEGMSWDGYTTAIFTLN